MTRRVHIDVPTGPEAMLLLSILNQAMADAKDSLEARAWLRGSWECAAYCGALNFDRRELVAALEAKGW